MKKHYHAERESLNLKSNPTIPPPGQWDSSPVSHLTSGKLQIKKGRLTSPVSLSPTRIPSRYKNNCMLAFPIHIANELFHNLSNPRPKLVSDCVFNSPRSKELRRIQSIHRNLAAHTRSPSYGTFTPAKELSNLNKIKESEELVTQIGF